MTSSAPSAIPSLTLTLFGPMQVLVKGSPLPHVRSRKSLWLLALLALRQGRPVEREWLASTLWPDSEDAAARMRPVLSELRSALGSEGGRLTSPRRNTLALEIDNADVDVLDFDSAISAGTLSALECAVTLYRGPLLEGCLEEWVDPERTAREQSCLRALETLVESAITAENWRIAADFAQRAVALDPWRDRTRRSLMEALAGSGDINAALHVYRQFVTLLRDDPRAAPDEQTTALYERLRTEARRPVQTAVLEETKTERDIRGHLPRPLTDLVGREEEREEVTALLRRSRLVTLAGPGGIGKTRLAIAVAEEAAPEFGGSVCMVSLEALSEDDRLPAQIAAGFGLKEEAGRSLQEVLVDYLRERRVLLVLDNCEHLLEATVQMASHLLRECAEVRILATSREPLRVTGETVWAVPALTVPDPDHLPAGQATLVRVLDGFEGVRLFVERAQAVQKTFTLDRENAQAMAEVCARLEGIPLALELAAARVRAMTVQQMAERLGDYLGLLTGGSRAALPRHQTMRATLDWSYALLSVPEQLLLGRLSIFAGGWTLEAAEAICSGEGVASSHVLELLMDLVDRSLIMFSESDSGGRYRLLEVVRQYAAERVGPANSFRSRHRDWYLALAEKAEPNLWGATLASGMALLEEELDNLRAALDWCENEAQGAEAGLRLASALAPFWVVRGYYREGRAYLARVLAGADGKTEISARARALTAAGMLASEESDYDQAQSLYEQSMPLFRQMGDRTREAQTLRGMGQAACNSGRYLEARDLLEQCRGLFRELGDRRGMAQTLQNLGSTHQLQGEPEAARALFEEGLLLFEEIGDLQGIATTCVRLGNVASVQRDYAGARAFYEKGLVLSKEIGYRRGIAATLSSLGNLAVWEGDYPLARTWLEESVRLEREMGDRASLAWSLVNLGNVLSTLEGVSSLRAKVREGLSLFEAVGHRRGIAASCYYLGNAACLVGDIPEARTFYRKGISLSRDLEDKLLVLYILEGVASAFLMERQLRQFIYLWGAIAAMREEMNVPLTPENQAKYDRESGQVRTEIGEDVFTAAWEEGHALTWHRVVAYALAALSSQEPSADAEKLTP